MPIGLGVSESEYQQYATERETFVKKNGFIEASRTYLKGGERFMFNSLDESVASFHVLLIFYSETNIHVTTRKTQKLLTAKPQNLVAPYEMDVFQHISDLQYHSFSVESATDVSVLFVPVMSLCLREIIYMKKAAVINGVLVGFTTDVGLFEFKDGTLTVNRSYHIVFKTDTFIRKLRTPIGNTVQLINKLGHTVDALAQYVEDGYICTEYLNDGLYLDTYDVQVREDAAQLKVLSTNISEGTAKIALLDSNGLQVADCTVVQVTATTVGCSVDHFTLVGGVIHLRVTGVSMNIRVTVQHTVQTQDLDVWLTMGVRQTTEAQEYIDLLKPGSADTFRLRINSDDNISLFQLMGNPPVETPVFPKKIRVGSLELTEDNGDLKINSTPVLNSRVIADPVSGDTALQIQNTRIVFTEQNRVRIDTLDGGLWKQGDYVYRNNLVELPLRMGFSDEVFCDLSSGEVKFSGVGGLNVTG